MSPRVQIQLDGSGRGRVLIDGQEVPYVTSIAIRSQAGEPTTVDVELIGADIDATLDDAEIRIERLGDDGEYWMTAFKEQLARGNGYWQALVDIAGLEGWENKAAGDIARSALEREREGTSHDG